MRVEPSGSLERSPRKVFHLPTDALSATAHAKYSVERVLALSEYTQSKSWLHVLWVMIRTLVIPWIVATAYEMIPLQRPTDGWRANAVFFIVRLGLGMFLVVEGGFTIMIDMIPEVAPLLSLTRRIVIGIFCGVVYAGSGFALAVVIGFPVPFTISLINIPGGLVFGACLLVSVRPATRSNDRLLRDCLRFCAFACVLPVLTIVYPAYVAFLTFVRDYHPVYQPLVTMLVPVCKWMMRHLVSSIVGNWEDMLPVIIIFSVEFFNAMFQVICVQSGGSLSMTALFMAIDFTHAGWSQWRLYVKTQTLRSLLGARLRRLLPVVSLVCDSISDAEISSHTSTDLRLRSSLRHCGLSERGERQLYRLSKLKVFASTETTKIFAGQQNLSRHVVLPATPSTRAAQPAHSQLRGPTAPTPEQWLVLNEAASVLFRTEYLLLVEFVECLVPLMFGINLVLLRASPNGAFYSYTREMTRTHHLAAALGNIGALLGLEAASMLALWLVLWRRLGFSPLHQVGYVLEYQAKVVQASLAVILAMSMQFNLDHLGTDYSFRFKWLHSQP